MWNAHLEPISMIEVT